MGLIAVIVKNHFSDYLASTLMLAYTNVLISIIKGPTYRLTKFSHIIGIGLLCCFFWEGLSPQLLPRSTADWLDCIAYIFGAITYWVICEKHTS